MYRSSKRNEADERPRQQTKPTLFEFHVHEKVLDMPEQLVIVREVPVNTTLAEIAVLENVVPIRVDQAAVDEERRPQQRDPKPATAVPRWRCRTAIRQISARCNNRERVRAGTT